MTKHPAVSLNARGEKFAGGGFKGRGPPVGDLRLVAQLLEPGLDHVEDWILADEVSAMTNTLRVE